MTADDAQVPCIVCGASLSRARLDQGCEPCRRRRVRRRLAFVLLVVGVPVGWCTFVLAPSIVSIVRLAHRDDHGAIHAACLRVRAETAPGTAWHGNSRDWTLVPPQVRTLDPSWVSVERDRVVVGFTRHALIRYELIAREEGAAPPWSPGSGCSSRCHRALRPGLWLHVEH